MKLSTEKFNFYKDQIKEDVQEHDTQLKDVNVPDEVIAMYEGRIGDFNTKGKVWENYLFIAANTVLSTLFYQIPRPIIKAQVSYLAYSASVIEGLIKHYFTDDVKEQNQLCILDAYLPYGYGVMKVGYNSRTGYVKNPSLLTGKTQGNDQQGLEENCEYIQYERPTLSRISPKYAFLDYSKPFGKGKHITFEHPRTLKELKESNLYELDANFINYFKSKNDDEAKTKFKLKEHWRVMVDGVYKLTYVEDWDEPLYWGKTLYKELPAALLRFNRTPDKVYSVSHGRHAFDAQKELNYLNELWKEHIDKTRRQHLIWSEALTESGRKTLKANEVDGIIETSKPVSAGVYAPISASPMNKDVYANIDNVRNYLKLILGVSGGRAGESGVDFATTEKAQAQGDFMRMSGMQDAIRDFVRQQLRMTTGNIVRLGNPEIVIKITGKNVIDPITGEVITGRELKFGGEDGLSIAEEIKGDVDNDYLYDVDITSAAKSDYAVLRKQYADFMALMVNPVIDAKLAEKGQKVDVSEIVKDFANMFETIPNPDKYFIEITPEEKMMMAQKQMMAQGGAVMPPPAGEGTPTPEAINAGVANIPI